MKKLLLLLTFCAATFSASAQETGPAGVRSSADYGFGSSDSRNNGFGIKAGFNLADLRGQDKGAYQSLESLKSYHAGAYAQFAFNNKLSIQPEFLFTRKGFDAQALNLSTGQPATTKEQTRLDYLQVPIVLVYNIFDNISVHAGPQVSLLVNAKYAGQERTISGSNLNSLEYGVVGGVEARVGPARLGARYDLGLADIYNDPKDASADAFDNVKNGVFQVYLGIGISN
jgi:hypothetical protein